MVDFFAVDVGYSSVKIAFNDGDTHSFPSTVDDFVDHGLIGGDNDYFVVDGKMKTAGKMVATVSHKKNTGLNFHGSLDWKVLMCASFVSLAEKEELFDPANPGQTEAVELKIQNLGVGLPFSETKPEKAAMLREACDFSFEHLGVSFNVEIGKVSVMHQGLAAMTLEENLPTLVGFVDVGFYTIDIVLVEDGILNPEFSTTFNSGVSYLHDKLNKKIRKEFGIPNQKTRELLRALNEKKLYYRGKDHDISEMVDECIKSFAQYVGALLRNEWDDYTDLMHQVNFTGGGSFFLESIIIGGVYRQAEDSVFGNAKGYLNIMRAWAAQGRLQAA